MKATKNDYNNNNADDSSNGASGSNPLMGLANKFKDSFNKKNNK